MLRRAPFAQLSRASALIFLLSLAPARGEDPALSVPALAGQYATDEEPNLTLLSLLPSGRFIMRSIKNLGDQAGRQVQGVWTLKSAQVTLRVSDPSHSFRWNLHAMAHGDSFDLVPEELVDLYREAPSNRGTRYRRFAGTSLDDERILSRSSAPIAAATAEKATARKEPPAKIAMISQAPPRKQTAAPVRPRPFSASTAPVFIFQPRPTEEMNVGSLRGPGLARLSIDARGKVIAVTIVESTGQRRFDADAADILHRWRVKPGPPREIEVPLTDVMNGKRMPVRVPLNSGSMTSG